MNVLFEEAISLLPQPRGFPKPLQHIGVQSEPFTGLGWRARLPEVTRKYLLRIVRDEAPMFIGFDNRCDSDSSPQQELDELHALHVLRFKLVAVLVTNESQRHPLLQARNRLAGPL